MPSGGLVRGPGWWRLSLLCMVVGALARADFHVAPGGDDSNPGTRRKPFATLEAARDAIRRLTRQGSLPSGGLTVWIAGGDHVRSQPLELTSEDSGRPGAPIRWAAAPGAWPRLLGGRLVTGFQPVADPRILQRLAEGARDKVLVADLRALGITEFGAMQSRGFGRPIVPAHSELFHGGRPMTLARWPDSGSFERIAGFPEQSGHGDDHGGSIGALPGGFRYAGERPSRWGEVSEVWVHGYWAWDWANSYERVASLDAGQHLIRTAPPHGLYGFRKGQRFHYLNVLEELDQPGEWYLDRESGRLYFRPPEGGPRTVETLLSLLGGPLVRMAEVSEVRLEGLLLEATRGSAVEIRGGSGVRVTGCRIANVGNHGVLIEGGTGHGVRSCDVLDTGDAGVVMSGGDRATLEPGRHFVENCRFERQGRWSKCYVPAVHLQGVGLRASHNLIQEHPHCAILYGGNDHQMEFNEIHHVALETGDVGAIYTGRDYTYRGNRIRHNFIHHTGGVGMGSMGAYMDDCVSGTEITGNVFYRVQRAAFLGGGRDHRVENNLFVDCDPAVQVDGRGLDGSPVWRSMVDRTMRERLAAVPLGLYRERYPEMKSLDAYYGTPHGPALEGADFKGVPPGNNRVLRNVCVGKWIQSGWHAGNGALELEGNLVGTDPGFVGAMGEGARPSDFALRPDSPAWALGFQRIPVEEIGVRPDRWRRRLDRRGQR